MKKYKDVVNQKIQKVVNKSALDFIHSFLMNRDINREYYSLVPEEKLDIHLVDNGLVKSDSPRQNLLHQVDTTRDYVQGIKTGELLFKRNSEYVEIQNSTPFSKDELLEQLDSSTFSVIETLQREDIGAIRISVPWSKTPVIALQMIWALNNHEILHTGWNLAYMDLFNIPRFPKLKALWG